jgi:hypothetical protein
MAISLPHDPIITEYVQRRAEYSGEDESQLREKIDRESTYERIYDLHQRFMAGEFSLGYMAQLLEITKADLYHLLDAMSLKVTNV